MKTTDLIPLILYQLADGDKYGYEIVQQIQIASNNSIVIKQPTLYSVLKKLEQGKFISSYWKDSEIGGKRHYYKLTDNGREQLSTYPTFEQLLTECNDEDVVLKETTVKPASTNTISFDDIFGSTSNKIDSTLNETPTLNDSETDNVKDNITVVNDEINVHLYNPDNQEDNLNQETNTEIDTDNVLDVSNDENLSTIDLTSSFNPIELNITSLETTTSNDNEIFKDESSLNEQDNEIVEVVADSISTTNIFDAIDSSPIQKVETEENKFAENENVATFTENIETNTEIVKPNKLNHTISTSDKSLFEAKHDKKDKSIKAKSIITETENVFSPPNEKPIERYDTFTKVKYLDYVDFKTDPDTIKRRKALKLRLIKMGLTCITLLIMLGLTLILANKQGFSCIYKISLIFINTILVFYPILMLCNIPKIKLKYSSTLFKYHLIRDLLIKLSLSVICIVLIVAYNIHLLDSFNMIIKFNNFTNLFTPIIFSSIFIFDFIYSSIIYKNYRK